ncbi:MAG: cobyrinate a,c-diamide synthase, partial [Oscillospiraceae bacterium]|nr:cobyrinate a,c-diamide synthase [Oscillospiraceae bacterium]
LALIEGVMGCYDGMAMDSPAASSYDIASKLDCPTVLIIPARGMAYTIVPIIKGLLSEDKSHRIKAVILNGVSRMTYMQLKPVIEKETGIKAAGYIPRFDTVLESRHLGLVMPEENTEKIISQTAETISETIDIDLLLDIASDCAELRYTESEFNSCYDVNIGVAYDEAFCFYYKDNIDILKSMGAKITYFSPLNDKKLPDNLDGIILGGGYPEVCADKLSKNNEFLGDIKNKIQNGIPCLAECGGFMYLHSSMEGEAGKEYKMADVIKGRAFKTDKLVRFGYINVSGENEFIKNGECLKAHEFHYWDSTANGNDCIAVKPNGKRSWECIHASGNIFAGFPHLYYRSNLNFIRRFLSKCSNS